MLNSPEVYTVSAVTRLIKQRLEESFQGIWIEGEISNYHHHTSGHRYLNLKDDRATIRVTIWRSVGGYLKFEPEDGQKVLAYGDIAVYEKGGNYQLNCRKLVPVGVGELELAFRQLHEKLAAEGLFDDDRKQPIPDYACRIGVVTSPTGAAVRDIIQIARRRNRCVELVVYATQVQGDGAEHTIAAGIEYFNSRSDIDVIIVGRGGGSLEDLWPFNTEVTVRAVAASGIPVISGSATNPDLTNENVRWIIQSTAAAELAVWSQREYVELVDQAVSRQATVLRNLVQSARQELLGLLNRPVFARPRDLVFQRRQYLDQLLRSLVSVGKNSFEKHRNRLSLSVARLETLSPLKILARGYSVSRRLPDRRVIGKVEDIEPGDRMETVLTDGQVLSVVEKIRGKNTDAVRKEVQEL